MNKKILNLKKEQNIKKIKVKTISAIIIESVFASLKLFVIPEFRFHKERQWKADYFLPDLKLVIEIEGAIFQNGRHNRATGFLKDIEKYNAITLEGLKLLRYATHEIERTRGQNVIDDLKKYLQKIAG